MRLERRRSGGWSEPVIHETLSTMRAVYERLPGDGYYVQVPGVFHADMTDVPLLTSRAGLSGPVGVQRAHQIINAYSLAFFDRHLKGRPAALLDGPPLDLYHSALQIWLPEDRFVIECAAILNLRGKNARSWRGAGRDELARPIPAFPIRDPSLAGRLHPRSGPRSVGSGPGGDGRRSRAARARSGALRPDTRVGSGRAANR
jgi:hypothetical protein